MEGFQLTREDSSLYSLQLERGARANRRKILFASSLPLARSIKSGIDKVSAKLASFGYSDFSGKELFTTATYALRKPGKMLRPALVFLGARLIGEETDDFIDMAAAAELLHTASLVHDDMIDRDTVRRGVPATHVKYGQEAALLAGDALIAKSVAMAARYGPKVTRKVAEASLDICAGELLDNAYHKGDRLLGVRQYLRIARLKSGVFMGTCTSIAATYKNSKKAGALYGFGLSLGIAFQIRDDIFEFVDANERRKNGNGSDVDLASNLVGVFARQFRIGDREALEKAIGLNNYFADRALGFVKDEKARDELGSYVDFVRVRTGVM